MREGAHFRQWSVSAALVLSDVLLALLFWEGASVLRGTVLREIWVLGPLSEETVALMVPLAGVWVGLRALLGLYPGYGLDSVEEFRRHVYTVLATLAILAVFAVASQIGDAVSRLQLFLVLLGLLLLAPIVRYLLKRGMKAAGLWGKPVVILSYKEAGTNIAKLLERNWQLGYVPLALFDYPLNALVGSLERVDHRQILADIVDLSWKRKVDTIILAVPNTRLEQLAKLVGLASATFRHVLITPDLGGLTNSAVVGRNFAGTLALEIKYNLLSTWALRTKRVMDICTTLIAGALILPLLLVLALLVYLESGGPVFYRARRIGRNGELFSCVKFRTMVPDAEAVLQRMLEEDVALREEYSKYHKLRDDPRVTLVGRFLRKTSLDELPQLWNILRGEMSLVGPRPYLPRESEKIGISQSEILRVPPGMTGPWQTTGRNQASFEERVQMDEDYVRDWSVWLDLILLARTIKAVVLLRGAR